MFENQKFLTCGVQSKIPSWLVNLMWHMVTTMEVQDMSWFDFLDTVHAPELIQYLKERRLYVNEPVIVTNEEE